MNTPEPIETETRGGSCAPVNLLAGLRELAWACVIKVMADYPDRNDKAVIVQNAMSELGPVPNSMGDAVRKAMAS
jgi:hypothetical protein